MRFDDFAGVAMLGITCLAMLRLDKCAAFLLFVGGCQEQKCKAPSETAKKEWSLLKERAMVELLKQGWNRGNEWNLRRSDFLAKYKSKAEAEQM